MKSAFLMLGMTLIVSAGLVSCEQQTPQETKKTEQRTEQPKEVQQQQEPVREQQAPQSLDAKSLAQSKGCFSCHSVDAKKVGPAFVEVAKKYAGKEGAVEELVNSITKGSMGKWGSIPMAPQPVSVEEAKTLAQWILSLK